MNSGTSPGLGIEVGYGTDAETDRDKRIAGFAWNLRTVEDKVDDSHGRSEQDSGNLVKSDCRVCQRKVRKDDIEAHGQSKRHHIHQSCSHRLKHAQGWSREEIKRDSCDGKMKGCERGLILTKLRIGKDGLVGENLDVCQ